jgi:hypothetical protein
MIYVTGKCGQASLRRVSLGIRILCRQGLAVGGLGGIFLSHRRRWSSGDYGFWPRSARRGRAAQAWRGLCVRHCLNLSEASKSESELRDVRSPSGARNSPPTRVTRVWHASRQTRCPDPYGPPTLPLHCNGRRAGAFFFLALAPAPLHPSM